MLRSHEGSETRPAVLSHGVHNLGGLQGERLAVDHSRQDQDGYNEERDVAPRLGIGYATCTSRMAS